MYVGVGVGVCVRSVGVWGLWVCVRARACVWVDGWVGVGVHYVKYTKCVA